MASHKSTTRKRGLHQIRAFLQIGNTRLCQLQATLPFIFAAVGLDQPGINKLFNPPLNRRRRTKGFLMKKVRHDERLFCCVVLINIGKQQIRVMVKRAMIVIVAANSALRLRNLTNANDFSVIFIFLLILAGK